MAFIEEQNKGGKKYFYLTETLRTGIGDGAVRDALVWAFYPKSVKGLSLEEAIELKTKEEKEVTNKATKLHLRSRDLSTLGYYNLS